MVKEYLTVKEFAEAAGVSSQTIYKQMKGRLKPYVVRIKGQTMIKAAALQEFYFIGSGEDLPKAAAAAQNSTDFQPDSTNSTDFQSNSTEKQLDSTDFQPDSTNSTDSNEDIKEEKEDRVNKNKENDPNTIEKRLLELLKFSEEEKKLLVDQVKEKDKQIAELFLRLEETNKNLTMAQQLAAADKKKVLELEMKISEIEDPAAEEKEDQLPKGKKSLWKRIFGK